MKKCVLVAVIGPALLAGCASYRALPLPDHDALAKDAAHVRLDTAAMPTAALRTHRFDPSDGLDMTEVAMLAVANNPELKLLRAEAGITRAQAFSAGLLPDPQLSLASERAMGSPAGATTAFTAGLAIDVAALLARSSMQAAANAGIRQSDLNLLWQEWQTVAKARLLFVKIDMLARSLALLDGQRAALQPRFERSRAAAGRGLITSDAAAPQLTALEDIAHQRNDLERQHNQARHDLHALLGIAPDVALALVGSPDIPAPDAAQVQSALNAASQHRPDLLALQAGYESQDDRYRAALKAQFPAITLGPTRARDTSDVNTVGLSLGLTLPLFNRNRGNIAIEDASREKLRVEYQQRLDTTAIETHRLVAEEAILLRQRTALAASVDQLARVAASAQTAFSARNIDALTLTNVEAALLARRLEQIAAEEALWEQAIALQALVGIDLDAPVNQLQPSS